MSISNEQRAHDYALCVLHQAYEEKVKELDEKSDLTTVINMFDIYVEIYNSALSRLNNLSK